MQISIVQINPDKLSHLHIYLLLGVLAAQWVAVPAGAALYRYFLARRIKRGI